MLSTPRTDLECVLEIKLLDFALKTGGESGVHGRASRQHDVLVELAAQIDIGSLRVEIRCGFNST